MTATRGRTRAGRLRALDAFLAHGELARGPTTPLRLIDVGVGDEPLTTLEWAAVHPDAEVTGVEHDAARFRRASAYQRARVRFVLGGFETLPSLGPANVVRAMNVLRGYREQDVPPAHRAMVEALAPEGLAIDGTSSPDGDRMTALLLRRAADGSPRREALLFHTDFRHGFSPWMFRDWLPRDLRRGVRPGTEIHGWFERWADAWSRARAALVPNPEDANEPAQVFARTCEVLLATGAELSSDPWLASHGYLLYRLAGGGPFTRDR